MPGWYGAARYGVANGRVTRVINGDARHKAIQTIAGIGPRLLLHRRGGKCAAGHIKLIPANTCWLGAVRVLANSARRPERFRAATVLINNRSHDFIAKGIDVLGRSQLRHDRKASATRECVDEWVNRDLGIRGMVRANAESGICRGGKIDMKEPGVDLGQGHAAGGRDYQWPETFRPCP